MVNNYREPADGHDRTYEIMYRERKLLTAEFAEQISQRTPSKSDDHLLNCYNSFVDSLLLLTLCFS